jgi:hypothetical protein
VTSWKVIVAIVFTTVVIFAAGIFTGGVMVNHANRLHPKNPRHPEMASPTPGSLSPTNGQAQQSPKPSRLPDVLSKQFLQRLDEELHLTPEQREAVQKIITEGQNQMRKAMMDTRLEIREQLTAEQRSHFDELVKRPLRKSPNSTNAPPVSAVLTNAPAY